MSPLETLAFGALWLALLLLAGLLFIVYRQIEKAYNAANSPAAGGLPAGVLAPDVEVLDDSDSERPLVFADEDSRSLLAFVTPDCAACKSVLEMLQDTPPFEGPMVALVNGERGKDFPGSRGSLQVLALAHPPDVVRSYGVSSVPLVYALRGRTILASKVLASRSGLEQLLAEADAYEDSVTAEAIPVSANGAH